MKVIACIVLSLVGAVYGNPTPDGEVNAGFLHEQMANSCPGRCFTQQPKYRDFAANIMPQFNEAVQGPSRRLHLQNIPAEKFDTVCTELGAIKTCVEACSDAADGDMKQKAIPVLTSAKDLVCDADIKNKFVCLAETSRIPSPQCDTQCQQFEATITEGTRNPTPGDFAKAKQVGTAVCQFVNCRLKCRKTDIINKCEQSGFDAAKKTVQKLGALAKTVHAQVRPAANFPQECNPDQLIQGA